MGRSAGGVADGSRTRERGRELVRASWDGLGRDLAHRRAQLLALGPAATLARGYAVVQIGPTILRSIDQAPDGTNMRVRVADGAVLAISAGPESPAKNVGTSATGD